MTMPWVYRDIDFSHCRYCDEVYVTVKRELELPDFVSHTDYGIWDGVTGMMALPADITIRGFRFIHPDARDTVLDIVEILRAAEKEFGDVRVHVVE